MLFNGNLRIEKIQGGTYGRTYVHTYRRTAYGRTDVRTSGNSPLCPTGHRPFGAAAQKGKKNKNAYTLYMASQFMCGRAGAVFEVIKAFGQEP